MYRTQPTSRATPILRVSRTPNSRLHSQLINFLIYSSTSFPPKNFRSRPLLQPAPSTLPVFFIRSRIQSIGPASTSHLDVNICRSLSPIHCLLSLGSSVRFPICCSGSWAAFMSVMPAVGLTQEEFLNRLSVAQRDLSGLEK
jgi:hypothetical protein